MYYDVNYERLNKQIECLIKCVYVMENTVHKTDLNSIFALSRSLHIGVECVLEIGNLLIEAFIMREPGSYEDIIDIIFDEKVIDKSLSLLIKELLSVRKQLVLKYDEIDQKELIRSGQRSVVFMTFIDAVRQFILKEEKHATMV